MEKLAAGMSSLIRSAPTELPKESINGSSTLGLGIGARRWSAAIDTSSPSTADCDQPGVRAPEECPLRMNA